MKRCPYCGAKYTDDVVRCPIDQELLVGQSAPAKPKAEQQTGYDIPPLAPNDGKHDWVPILCPHSSFEVEIVLGRLLASGIRARKYDSVIGGWIGRDSAAFIEVRVEDYDAARDLLNAT